MVAKKVPTPTDGTDRTSKAQSRKVGRDAATGKFVTIKHDKKSPKHTVVETIKKPGKKKT